MRKSLMIFATILLLAMSATTLVGAKKTTFKAGGILTDYEDAYSSEIVSGHWSVTVNGDEVTDFKMFYVELNLVSEPEYSPVGSHDQFWYTLDSVGPPSFNDGVLSFDCTFKVIKLMTMMDGTKEWRDPFSFKDCTVTICQSGLHIEITYYTDPPQDFDILGVINYLKTS